MIVDSTDRTITAEDIEELFARSERALATAERASAQTEDVLARLQRVVNAANAFLDELQDIEAELPSPDLTRAINGFTFALDIALDPAAGGYTM